jgi:hypothetical protein
MARVWFDLVISALKYAIQVLAQTKDGLICPSSILAIFGKYQSLHIERLVGSFHNPFSDAELFDLLAISVSVFEQHIDLLNRC